MRRINDIDTKSKTKYFLDAINNKNSIDIADYIKFASEMSREIYLSLLTPAIADNIERTIRFWNNVDESEGIDSLSRKPINIYINSFGGSLDAAFTIIDIIKNSKTPVYTINTGVCQREALYLYLAGHKRYAYPRSSFCLDKRVERLDFSEGQSNYEDFKDRQNQELKEMILEITKITETDFNSRKIWWITADKANDLRICHEVLRNKII